LINDGHFKTAKAKRSENSGEIIVSRNFPDRPEKISDFFLTEPISQPFDSLVRRI
jgi:hypothetical protein